MHDTECVMSALLTRRKQLYIHLKFVPCERVENFIGDISFTFWLPFFN